MQQTMKQFSPRPPEDYSVQTVEDGPIGVGFELRRPEHRALWNLYWLSEPRLDEFLQGGPTSVLNFDMYKACRAALSQVVDGVPLETLLDRLSPTQLAAKLEGATHLEPFKLGGAAWLDTVRARSATVRGVVREQAGVVHVNFSRKVGVTSPVG